MKKQIQLFLTDEEEAQLTLLLSEAISDIKFLNDNVWLDRPDNRSGIELCDSGRVYLFEGDLKSLPAVTRKTGEIEGPIAGCVIQILRPSLSDGIMLSGRIAAGYDKSSNMEEFVSKVWRCLKKLGRTGVVRGDGTTDSNYLVGDVVREKVANGALKIADRATRMIYTVKS